MMGSHLHARKIASEHAAKELDLMIGALKKSHARPFLHISEQELTGRASALKRQWLQQDSLDKRLYTLDLMKFTALFGDAHLQIYWEDASLHGNPDTLQLFPFVVKNEGEQLFATEGETTFTKQLTAINGHNASQLYQEALQTQAGTGAFVRYFVQRYFFPVFLHLKGIHPPFQLTFADGEVRQSTGLCSFRQVAGRFAPNVDPYTFEILQGNIGYLQYNLCEDYQAFNAFLKSTFARIDQQGVNKLVIDIRNNMGGNSALNDLLIPYFSQKKYRQSSGRHWKVSQAMKDRIDQPLYRQAFGKKFIKQYKKAANGSFIEEDEYSLVEPKKVKYFFEGELFVLIGPQTFSSANFLADAIKTYELATLVGQPTGEPTNDFGEIIPFQLPHSGLGFNCSVAYDTGADGDPDKISVVHPDVLVEEDALEYVLKRWRQ